MSLRVRPPDLTYVAAIALVAIVQIHYWELAPKFGGTRQAEVLFTRLTELIFGAIGPPASALDVAGYRYFYPLNDALVVSAFALPALAILLVGRMRSPRLTILVLRVAAALYVTWLLLLSPVVLEVDALHA